jgi:hypothetical protein
MRDRRFDDERPPVPGVWSKSQLKPPTDHCRTRIVVRTVSFVVGVAFVVALFLAGGQLVALVAGSPV